MLQPVKKICHITTVHPRYDIRIYHKECITLSSLYSVYLIVADGLGDNNSGDIRIIDAGAGKGSRIKRILFTTSRVYKQAISLDCDIYHFHDPEFLFYAWKLIRKGKNVIYDVHEDVPKQTLSKDYIWPVFRKFLAFSIGFVEKFISSRLSAVITVTWSINQRFSKWNDKCVIINNYPTLEKLFSLPVLKRSGVCYIGNISSIRGIEIILDSLLVTDTILHLAGEFETEELRNRLYAHPAWTKVKYYGIVGNIKAMEIIGSSAAGLVTYLPVPNHMEAQPNKMFEYMSCGTPVIASDFPLWKDIIEKNGCGLCINPLDDEGIANAIKIILSEHDKAGEMGLNGQNVVQNKYNWETEGLKLKNLYADLLQ